MIKILQIKKHNFFKILKVCDTVFYIVKIYFKFDDYK